jgi:hypothetical protein
MKLFRLFSSFALAVLLFGQGGRFEQQKRQGLAYLKDGKYEKAAAKLEEVWDYEKSDPMVAEGLAIAYLNGTDRRNNPDLAPKAYELMDKQIQAGGKAVFLVVHSHEKLGFLQGHELTNYCAGQLQVRSGRISYVSETGDKGGQHSFDLAADDIKEISPNFDRGRGMFHIKTRDKQNYNMAPRSWDEKDSQFLFSLVVKYVKPMDK